MKIGERPNPPKGWREGHDSSLACPHRDCSVCPACALANPEAQDCAGAHFWIPLSLRDLVSEDPSMPFQKALL